MNLIEAIQHARISTGKNAVFAGDLFPVTTLTLTEVAQTMMKSGYPVNAEYTVTLEKVDGITEAEIGCERPFTNSTRTRFCSYTVQIAKDLASLERYSAKLNKRFTRETASTFRDIKAGNKAARTLENQTDDTRSAYLSAIVERGELSKLELGL